MSEISLGYEANLQRGQLLRETGRYSDACRFLRAAIEADADQPQPYLELALAESGLPRRQAESLAAVDRAVALAPNSAHFVGYKAYLLSRFGRQKEALEVAARALQLNPNSHIALLAQANGQTKLGLWSLAETTARRMLQLNPTDTAALNLLAQALRFRRQLREAREVTRQILARVPNDIFGQANAGYEALEVGDHRRANAHFLNALRIDPHYEHARKGLLQSLRARNWIYRMNQRVILFFDRHRRPVGWMRVAVIFSFMITGGLAAILWTLYILVALTVQPLSNFFLLLDPAGRRALRPKERNWAIFNGVITVTVLVVLAFSRFNVLFFPAAGYIALFALGVYVPQWADAWRARREEKQLAAEHAP